MNIACPHCKGLMVGDGIAPGSAVICPHCQNQFAMTQAPAPSAAAPRPAPARAPEPQVPPLGGQAPTPTLSMPAPKVAADPTGTVRHRGADSSTMMLVGGVSVLGLVVILGIFFLVLAQPARKSAPKKSGDGDGLVKLRAHVRCSSSEITLTNKDPFDWHDVVIEVRSDAGGSPYRLEVGRMVDGRVKSFGFEQFVNDSGDKLGSRSEISTILVRGDVQDVGPGECKVVAK